MIAYRHLAIAAAALGFLAAPSSAQRAHVREASAADIPFQVDGNSPAFWWQGRFTFLTSTGKPVFATGQDPQHLSGPSPVLFDTMEHFPIWIEAAWVDSDGTIYGWYHHEPQNLCPGNNLTAPQIGAAISYDGGSIFYDLGLILTSAEPIDCQAKNGYFAGGNGDFSVIPDREQGYFYFLFTHYGGDLSRQGVATARLAFADRNNPVGAVWKYYNGEWNEPGLEGQVTPVFPARAAWQREDADSFWGPAVHWNTHLNTYVVLLNHACCEPGWPQEGVFVAFNPDLSAPSKWTDPTRLMNAREYYPQVIGAGPDGSDTLAGEVARLYVHGKSRWEVVFAESEELGEPHPEPPPEEPIIEVESVPVPVDPFLRRSVPSRVRRRP